MAETKQFTVEGEVSLAYFWRTGERDSRHVLLKDSNAPSENDLAIVPASEQRLETYIAQILGFPNDAEYDEMLRHLEELRKQGMRPAEGQPDYVREGVRLRITVEVL
jgi:hypothetical protein